MKKVIENHLFDDYKSKYEKRPADLRRMEYSDEISQINEVVELLYAPMESIEAGSPPIGSFGDGEKKYLWVVMEESVVILLEEGTEGRSLSRNRASHTNLTGNAEAYCGGELWFNEDSKEIWLSGGSSRYQPRNGEELQFIESWFKACAYNVTNFGWEEETGRPVRFLRG